MALFKRKRVEPETKVEQRATYRVPSSSAYVRLGFTHAGQLVTIETSRRNATVAACVRVLKTSISMLPVDEVIVRGNVRIPTAPSPIVANPSARVGRRGFVAQLVDSLATAGNAYADIVAHDAGGMPVQVESIDPDAVRWRVTDGELVPYVNNVPRITYPRGNLLHIPATAFLRAGSPVADSPIELAKEAIGAALAASEFGARFFGDGAHPSAIVFSDEPLDEDGAGAIKGSVIKATSGNREPAVFGSGLKYQQIQVSPDDSQFLDLMRFEVEEMCRFLGVPPWAVYGATSGQNVTYANVAQGDHQFLKYGLSSWLTDIEDAWSALIPEPRIVRINVGALLRMDAETRWKIHDLRLKNKTTSINEVRALEDEQPFAGESFNLPGIPEGDGSSKSMTARELSEALQKIYLSVDTVISADEAREILNREGANLPVPGPVKPEPAPAPAVPPSPTTGNPAE